MAGPVERTQRGREYIPGAHSPGRASSKRHLSSIILLCSATPRDDGPVAAPSRPSVSSPGLRAGPSRDHIDVGRCGGMEDQQCPRSRDGPISIPGESGAKSGQQAANPCPNTSSIRVGGHRTWWSDRRTSTYVGTAAPTRQSNSRTARTDRPPGPGLSRVVALGMYVRGIILYALSRVPVAMWEW